MSKTVAYRLLSQSLSWRERREERKMKFQDDMKAEKTVPKVVSKLNSLLSSHFGVAVQYIPVGASIASFSGGGVANALETAKRNSNAPMIVAHDQMIIP